jgi:3-hydroxyethyl bacteriochlorophyllide a dehydrogenase
MDLQRSAKTDSAPEEREAQMETTAVLLDAPGRLTIESLRLNDPKPGDILVRVTHSGISTGTEKLFYTGKMPPFPGMGYPLVPGYESIGEIVEAGPDSGRRVGETVFVPGADCYGPVRGLFGGAASAIVTAGDRVVPLDAGIGPQGALLALAATARHAVAGLGHDLPDLIVGHGVLGRLIARITLAAGGRPPVVWDLDATRRDGAVGYTTIHPDEDERRDYRTIFDVSGDNGILNKLMFRLAKGGEIVLAGFYDQLTFAFPPAFMKEARIRVAAEWNRDDMLATRMLVEEGTLSLDGLITHTAAATDAAQAYETAFGDPACLKMILDWKGRA